MNKELTTIEKLNEFVNQRSGIDRADYDGDSKLYNATVKDITKDRNDYYELLSLFLTRYGSKAESVLTEYLQNSNGRLELIKRDFSLSILEYTPGQYFPTEYRVAACSVLSKLIWQSFRDEQVWNPHNRLVSLYKDGHEMRDAIGARVSKRVMKLYFN